MATPLAHRIPTSALARLISVALLLGGCASLGPSPPAHFDLTGRWELDAAASDAPPALRGPEADSVPRGGGRGRSGGRGNRGGAGESPALLALAEPLLRVHRFEAFQDATSMTLAFDSHPDVDVRFGETETRRGRVEAGWTDEGVLEIRGRGPARVQRFTLTEDAGQLTVVTELEPPRGEVLRIVRVFRRADEAVPRVTTEVVWDRPLDLSDPR